ncbi:hypothetical protein WA026_006313 [Henosepilachna vigintioctopunctata]|uniref:Uncharacterized protein n=1 Tax=Henosepilachna vigintioctopunctata TaxID=420089 RepID=A0AAW1TJ76_9CUCU
MAEPTAEAPDHDVEDEIDFYDEIKELLKLSEKQDISNIGDFNFKKGNGKFEELDRYGLERKKREGDRFTILTRVIFVAKFCIDMNMQIALDELKKVSDKKRTIENFEEIVNDAIKIAGKLDVEFETPNYRISRRRN